MTEVNVRLFSLAWLHALHALDARTRLLLFLLIGAAVWGSSWRRGR